MKVLLLFVILPLKYTRPIKVILGEWIRAMKEFQIELSDRAITVKIVLQKNEETMQKHLSICAAKESITYSFDNSQIIYCQDNFKYTLCISIWKLLQEMLFF